MPNGVGADVVGEQRECRMELPLVLGCRRGHAPAPGRSRNGPYIRNHPTSPPRADTEVRPNITRRATQHNPRLHSCADVTQETPQSPGVGQPRSAYELCRRLADFKPSQRCRESTAAVRPHVRTTPDSGHCLHSFRSRPFSSWAINSYWSLERPPNADMNRT